MAAIGQNSVTAKIIHSRPITSRHSINNAQFPFKMADKTMPISVPSEKPIKLVKWKIKQGAFVSRGQILFLYSDSSGNSGEIKKYKAIRAGTVSCIKVKEGDVVEPGSAVAELEECRHPTVMKDMCAECGADLRIDESAKLDVAVVPMVHSVPELKVSEELAQKLGREDAERLLKDRKLVLLVDLDQTLVHTTNDNIPPNLKDVLHFFLRAPGSPGRWCHTRLRPHTQKFLESASKNYELHVCTFGARQYAHAIADLLDPEKKYFSHRILSRDECFDPRTKAANLKALFPCGDNMVCIIDDREDVWRRAHNLIHVRPYSFFQATGDINAPPPPLEEKPKLPSGKNGAQVSVIHQMPTLDAEEPEQKEEKDKEQIEGDNGKIVNKEEKKEDVTEEGEEKVEDAEGEESQDPMEPKWIETADGQIEVEDPDDYLIYLEDILKRIHKHFYDIYDKTEGKEIPDLKQVIPEVKSKVLAGCSLVFSGLVPTHQKLETSRAYQVAKGLGAEVTQDFTDETTHLVAVRSGTAKVNASRKLAEGKKLHVVTPEWLWTCAERWERVDERLYPLQRGGQSVARRPPAHCSSPPLVAPPPRAAATPAPRRRTPSGRFMDTLNPLLSFSSADIADMDREVEDIFNESDESSSDEESAQAQDDDLDDEENPPEDRLISVETEESSQERLTNTLEADDDSDTNLDDEGPRRKRARPSTPPSDDDDEPPDDDDSSWRLMGAALEREFLAQD